MDRVLTITQVDVPLNSLAPEFDYDDVGDYYALSFSC